VKSGYGRDDDAYDDGGPVRHARVKDVARWT
jgi:hypothetical protein